MHKKLLGISLRSEKHLIRKHAKSNLWLVNQRFKSIAWL